jgi:hypothetical protein
MYRSVHSNRRNKGDDVEDLLQSPQPRDPHNQSLVLSVAKPANPMDESVLSSVEKDETENVHQADQDISNMNIDNEVEKLDDVIYNDDVPSSNSSVMNQSKYYDESQFYSETPAGKQIKRHLDFSVLFDEDEGVEEPEPKKRFTTTPLRIPGNDLILSSTKKPSLTQGQDLLAQSIRPLPRPIAKRKQVISFLYSFYFNFYGDSLE